MTTSSFYNFNKCDASLLLFLSYEFIDFSYIYLQYNQNPLILLSARTCVSSVPTSVERTTCKSQCGPQPLRTVIMMCDSQATSGNHGPKIGPFLFN